MASLGSFLERVIGGDARISRDQKALGSFGDTQFGLGSGIAGEGIAGIRDSIGRYDTMLATGRPLPESVYRAYDSLRGGIGDESMRSMAAVRASIAQRRAAAGGFLSPEAAEEYNRLGESDVREQAFNATRDVGVARSRDELAAVQDLYGRLDASKAQLLNHGEYLQQLGFNAKLQSLLARHNRLNAMFSTMSSAAVAGV